MLDRVGAREWQIVQKPQAIELLVAQPSVDFDGAAVLAEIDRALAASGAEAPALRWVEVDAIPRTGTGKAPLIRAAPSPSDAEPIGPQ